MSDEKPIVEAVRVKPLANGAEAVGALVAGRHAGSLVVDPGRGEPLARLLLSAPVVVAARELAACFDRVMATEERVRAIRALMLAIDAVDGAIVTDADLDAAEAAAARRSPAAMGLKMGRPWEQLDEASNLLFYGNTEGRSGDSIFRAVALIATPLGTFPEGFGSFNGSREACDCWTVLAAKLREMADDVDRQAAAAAAGVPHHGGGS